MVFNADTYSVFQTRSAWRQTKEDREAVDLHCLICSPLLHMSSYHLFVQVQIIAQLQLESQRWDPCPPQHPISLPFPSAPPSTLITLQVISSPPPRLLEISTPCKKNPKEQVFSTRLAIFKCANLVVVTVQLNWGLALVVTDGRKRSRGLRNVDAVTKPCNFLPQLLPGSTWICIA